MRRANIPLVCLLFLSLVALIAGCGSTSSNSGSGDSAFSLTADSSVTIAQGESRTFTVTPSSTSSFAGSIQVSVSGLPAGVSIAPANATVAVGTSTTFTLTAASNAAIGANTVTVQGVSGTISESTSLSLTVTATASAGDFTLAASPATLTLAQGTSGQVTLSSTATGAFSGTVSVAVQGLPTGVTVSPATISITPGTPLVITLTAASNAPSTTTPVQVSFIGTSGSLSHTTTMQVSVSAVANFSLTTDTATMTVAQGTQSNVVRLTVQSIEGFSGTVTFTVSGLPTGVIAVPQTGALEAGWSEPIAFEAAADAPLGNASITITGTAGALTHTVTVALSVVAPPPPDFVALALSPSSATIIVGSVGTVSVTATATEGYTGTVNVSLQDLPAGVTASPATAALTPGVPQTFTLIATGNASPGTATVTFFGQVNSVNGTADLNLTVAKAPNNGLDVPTWHYDAGRTGLNSSEKSLTTTSVTAAKFGKLTSETTDGAVDAQPLYLSKLAIGSNTYNVLYAATENGSVYAWNAGTGALLWKTSTLAPGEAAAGNQGCSELPAQAGITGTPVIDRNFAPDGAIFLVAKTKDTSGNYHQRLHALDLTTGAELSGSPVEIAASYPANGGATDTFSPSVFAERAALLLNNGTLYLSWTAPCQETSPEYSGWVMAYSEGTLAQLSALDLTPNGSGAGIWMSGAGPAADINGNVFLATSKGTFDTTLNTQGKPVNGDYGNGYVELQQPNGVLTVDDYFEPLNGVPGAAHYADQGTGGVMLTRGTVNGTQVTPSFGIAAGEDGNIYVLGVAGNVLGEYNGTTDNNSSTVTNALPNGATSTPAYFNGAFYYGGSGDVLRQFTLSASGAAAATQSAKTLGTSGATPVVSANGTNTAILWALDTTASGGPVLHAYDATNLATELYNSTTQATRDAVGATDQHAVPIVANGYVYIGTQSGVDVFGLLP